MSFALRIQKLKIEQKLEKFRIQFAYRLDPIDLAWGYIMGFQTEVLISKSEEKRHGFQARMSVDQMVAIGRGRLDGRSPLHYSEPLFPKTHTAMRTGLVRCSHFYFMTAR